MTSFDVTKSFSKWLQWELSGRDQSLAVFELTIGSGKHFRISFAQDGQHSLLFDNGEQTIIKRAAA